MNEIKPGENSRTGSIIVSGFFILIGLITLYDTMQYADIDSKIFPRTVAIILIICSVIAFAKSIFGTSENGGFGHGSWWRRVLLVGTMLLACLAMPYVGFLVAAAIAFTGGLICAMHHRWTRRTIIQYSVIGIIVMCAFYSLFRFVLLVPLP